MAVDCGNFAISRMEEGTSKAIETWLPTEDRFFLEEGTIRKINIKHFK